MPKQLRRATALCVIARDRTSSLSYAVSIRPVPVDFGKVAHGNRNDRRCTTAAPALTSPFRCSGPSADRSVLSGPSVRSGSEWPMNEELLRRITRVAKLLAKRRARTLILSASLWRSATAISHRSSTILTESRPAAAAADP